MSSIRFALPDAISSPARRPWILLAVFVVTTGALALLYAAFIRTIDPYHQFGTERYPVLTEDARSEKLRMFRDFAASGPVEGIVLGSSRSMKLAPSRLAARSNARFFNFSVASARAEDHVAISRWVRTQTHDVRLVVIGLDIEALHDVDPTPSPLEFNRELQAMLTGGSDATMSTKKKIIQYKRAFGISQFVDALKSLALAAGFVNWERTQWFEADGRLRYGQWERQQEAGTYDVNERISSCEPDYVNRIGNMRALSATRLAALETTVREWRAAGAIVRIFITPLHEHSEPYLVERTQYASLLGKTRVLLNELARDAGVYAYDYSHPETFGALPTEWFDCNHLNDDGAARLVDALFGARG